MKPLKLKNTMKNTLYYAGLFGIIFLFSFNLSSAQNAVIRININDTIGHINKNIFGNFAEHLGRCIYGGIYDEGSPLSDENGFRKDVKQAVKDLHVPLLRYPGGNFVSNYHWEDGVGPKDQRPTRLNLAWGNIDNNHFGTDEFMEYCKEIGTEPYLAVNMGTGTMREAQAWVEYCNVADGPYYAELRQKYGHEEPYNVKYWSLGNEVDGPWQIGHMNAEDYSKKAKEFGKIMKLTDPSIKLIAVGAANFNPGAKPYEWDRTILQNLKNEIDYLSMHMYVGNVGDSYYDFVASPLVMEKRTKIIEGMIDEVMLNANRGNRDPIYIAWDEYNVWYRARSGGKMVGNHALEERYNLEDALVIAGFLNGFIRNADVVKMANLAQLVNVIAPIFTSKTDMFKQTIYYPLQLFAKNMQGTSLDVFVHSDTYDTDNFFLGLSERKAQLSNVPYLDVSASYEDGEVVLAVVNRNKDKAITTDIISSVGKFSGSFKVWEINGPDIKSKNNFDQTLVETKVQPEIEANGNTLTYAFPPHSITMLKGKIQ